MNKHIKTIINSGNVTFAIHISLFVIIMTMAIIPLTQQMFFLKNELNENEAQENVIRESRVGRIKSQDQLSKLSKKSILEVTFPSEKNIIEFIEVFERASEKTGVDQLLQLQTKDRRVLSSGIVEIPASLHLSQSWESKIQFLAFIEQEDFYMNPSKISIQSSTDDGKEQDMVVQLKTYWQEEK